MTLTAHPRASRTVRAGAGLAGREAFVERVATALTEAGVEYAMLHGARGHEVDSDLDVAVDADSVALVDALLATGALGRLVQRLRYDIPWCVWYVVETGDPLRPYRQLDIACDPWGSGRYGTTIRRAVAAAVDDAGVRVAPPAVETLYLVVKRARKGLVRAHDERQLQQVFARDPKGARVELERELGSAGVRVAAVLDGTADERLGDALAMVRRRLARRRLTPSTLVRRSLLGARRVGGRIARPPGVVVTVAGPDGVGKSSLVTALEPAAQGLFRRFARLHGGPSVLPAPGALLGRSRDVTVMTEPHRREPSGRAGSIARVSYLWLDACLAWLPRVAWPRRRSTLVVVERGWDDLSVDPRRYRVHGIAAFVALLGRLQPRVDLVVVLDAPATVVHARKPELTASEIGRQRAAWRSRAAGDPDRFVVVDASREQEEVVAAVRGALVDRVAARHARLVGAEAAIRCLGGLHVRGRLYDAIGSSRSARWFLPRGAAVAGPVAAGMYRPAQRRHRAGAVVLRGSTLLPGRSIRFAAERGVGPRLAEALGIRTIDLAVAPTKDAARDRLVASVLHDGKPIAFTKIVPRGERAALDHELQLLALLSSSALQTLRVPKPVEVLEWEQWCALLMLSVPTPGYADRELSDTELGALAELAGLGDALEPVLGRGEGTVPIHGDFAPWNCAVLKGELAVWDWEGAGLGLPLEDLFHWRAQRLALFRVGSPETLVRGAFEPDWRVRGLCARLGIEPSCAPAALESALERGLRGAARRTGTALSDVRIEALELLRSVRR